MIDELFDILILTGRPASGKSEIIDYLSSLDSDQRRGLHLGDLVVVDDFPMLWTWFEEDKLLSQMGKPGLHTDDEGYFKDEYLWDLLVRRLCLDYGRVFTAPDSATLLSEGCGNDRILSTPQSTGSQIPLEKDAQTPAKTGHKRQQTKELCAI